MTRITSLSRGGTPQHWEFCNFRPRKGLHARSLFPNLQRSDKITAMTTQIDTLLDEQREFPPSPAFAAQANATDALYRAAAADREGFWAEQATLLDWITPWHTVLEWNLPHAKWFVGGQLNVSVNCLDRHLETHRRDKTAIIWEGEPGEERHLTYAELSAEVNRCANEPPAQCRGPDESSAR